MALSIKDAETDRLARELSEATGESITTAVATAVRERLERVRGTTPSRDLVADLISIAARCSRLPLIDSRPPDKILGYDRDGLPT